MKPEIEIPKHIQHHLERMDESLDQMVASNFNHERIHAYREAIRKLRALIYFFKPLLRNSDFKDLDYISKRNFDHTSLIREIDVFENGYRPYMNAAVAWKLSGIKAPLLEKLASDAQMMKTFHFAQFEVRLKPSSSHKTDYEVWEKERHKEVLKHFINMDAPGEFESLERYIHEKRSLAKKLHYIHEVLMPEDQTLAPLNQVLDDFQDVARRLHDVCVNLRFVGQYQLDDPKLLETLITHHELYLVESDSKYEEACRLLTSHLEDMEAQ